MKKGDSLAEERGGTNVADPINWRMRHVYRSRNAEIAWRAADSSANCSTDPRTILRCFLLPSALGSRHLNSQTSGPRCRSARITLPFCMYLLSCLWTAFTSLGLHKGTIQAQIVFRRLQKYAISVGGKDARGYCFAAATPSICLKLGRLPRLVLW